MLGELIASVEGFHAFLRRGQAVNVNDQSSKDRAIALANEYFSVTRPGLVETVGETQRILDHDQLWQQLVRLAHGNNARQTYLRNLTLIRRQLADMNIDVLASQPIRGANRRTTRAVSREEALIIATLERLVPSAAASYSQGLADLYGADRLSYRGTAAEFRESLRETLDHLAPDPEVTAQAGFKLESGQTRPTMKQKVRFVLTSRGRNKTQRDAAEKSLALIEELSGEVMRAVYNRASLATHVQGSKGEVATVKRYVDTVFFDLLEISS
jgi:hypothetical protein